MTNILQALCLNEKALKSLCAPLTLVLPHLWQTPNMTTLMKMKGGRETAKVSKINNSSALKIKSKAYSSALQFASKKESACVHSY